MMTDSNARPLGSALVTLAALVIVLAGMRAAAEIVVPFLLVLFIAILCAPAVFRQCYLPLYSLALGRRLRF